MTVLKSQGSEFKQVVFLLPDREIPVLTKALIYTTIPERRSWWRFEVRDYLASEFWSNEFWIHQPER